MPGKLQEVQEEKKKSRKEGDKARLAAAAARLGVLQRRLKDEKIPVIITFDGFDAAGKGLQISRLIQALDPRGFEVYAVKKETREEKMHPFLWRFWMKMPWSFWQIWQGEMQEERLMR